MSEAYNQKRVLKNTILLYARMLFTMWLNLYTTRLVLANLGVEDMGVYGVVGSITGLFTVFVSGVTSAIQRFITFELGRRDGNVNNVFCTSLNILFIAAFFLLILLEVGGLWMLNYNLNIPEGAVNTAFWVFQLSVLTCLVSMVSIPYNALVVAHEKMGTFAFISIFQVALTCASAYTLSLFQQQERLLIYAVMMAVIGIIVRIVYQIYCHIHFKEAEYHRRISKKLLKEIGKYAGISTTSGILQIVSNQGIALVINWTFGVAVNAVYNIAVQLKNMILSFSLNFMRALSPQITKTYASGEIEIHKKLVYKGSKLEIFLIYFIMIPFLFRTEYIMKLWLGDVPDHLISFVRMIVFVSLVASAMEPVREAVFASNRIVHYLIVPDSLFLLVLPISYFVGYVTNNPDRLMITIVIGDIICCILRVYIGIKETLLNLFKFVRLVILPCFYVVIISSFCCYILSNYFKENIIGFMSLLFCNSFLLFLWIYLFGLDIEEKRLVKQIIYNRIIKSISDKC